MTTPLPTDSASGVALNYAIINIIMRLVVVVDMTLTALVTRREVLIYGPKRHLSMASLEGEGGHGTRPQACIS